jgi:hypothetical protein
MGWVKLIRRAEPRRELVVDVPPAPRVAQKHQFIVWG